MSGKVYQSDVPELIRKNIPFDAGNLRAEWMTPDDADYEQLQVTSYSTVIAIFQTNLGDPGEGTWMVLFPHSTSVTTRRHLSMVVRGIQSKLYND